MRIHLGRFSALALVLALAACSSTPTEGTDLIAGRLGIFIGVRGWIAYGDARGEEPGIWAMDPANPDAEPILLDPDGGDPVAWSSDGTKLLIFRLSSFRADELLVLNADGTETHLATDVDGHVGGSFTPDGSQVVYHGPDGIYSVAADGGSPRLIYDPGHLMVFTPVLSPDGSRVAFFEGRGDWGNSLWVMNFDGTDKRRVLGWKEAGRHPGSLQWSPDGTRLAFKREADPSFGVVNVDGSGLAFVAGGIPYQGPDTGPYWSPDGTHLAIVSGPDDSPSLAIVRPDGTGLQKFSVGRAGPWNPLDPTAPPPTTATVTATAASWPEDAAE